jgi:hypothetical protein
VGRAREVTSHAQTVVFAYESGVVEAGDHHIGH